jgi:hypothetical protein
MGQDAPGSRAARCAEGMALTGGRVSAGCYRPGWERDRKSPGHPNRDRKKPFSPVRLPKCSMPGRADPGKTDALLMDFAQHVGRGFGADWNGIIFRRTFPELKDIINKSRKWFPRIWPNAKFNASQYIWTWATGEMLSFRQFNKPADYWKYHGHAVTLSSAGKNSRPGRRMNALRRCFPVHAQQFLGCRARLARPRTRMGVGHTFLQSALPIAG